MTRRPFYGNPEDFRDEEREKYFYHEDPRTGRQKIAKEDLDTLDGWDEPDGAMGGTTA